MNNEASFLQAILAQPEADDTWMVLADWLEETGQAERAELVRLQLTLRRESNRERRRPCEKRVQTLLLHGVRPCVPTITNSLGMQFALIPPGLFWMGSSHHRGPADEDEFPAHLVEITKPFFLGVHHVTQGQYQRIMRRNPSYFGPKGAGAAATQHLDRDNLPVESVSFEDIELFCRRLSDRVEEKKAGRRYGLPTEAQWEYACRAGICHTAYHFGSRLRIRLARFNGHGNRHPLPVGSHLPNLFGLHDMHGNVWEWTADWYDADYYSKSPLRDPTGPATGHRRVLRGGGWSTPPELCRSALRGHNSTDARHNYNGFRLALPVTPQ